MAKRTILLDVKLPFRHKKDLEAMPNEKHTLISKLHEARGDRLARAAWAKLLKDHEADEVWIQAYRQDPRHPFAHEKPHLTRSLKTDTQQPTSGSLGESGQGTPPSAKELKPGLVIEPEQRTGKSGQLVITVHFPKNGTPRSDAELAKKAIDFLGRIEKDHRFQKHCRDYGYRTGSARGQEHDDPESLKHNSISGSVDSGCGWSGGFSILPPAPTISGFSPASGPVGAPVTLTGMNFSGASAVTFNGTPASFSVTSDMTIAATPLVGSTTGPLGVTTTGGTATSSPNTFAVAPTLSNFSPPGGPVGAPVVLTGMNFGGATAATFNGVPASFGVNTDSQITATVPAGATTGPIAVTTPAGIAASAPYFAVAPTLSSFSPASGPAGTPVTLTGMNFSGASEVAFNGMPASFSVVSDTGIAAAVPAGATTGAITVTTPAGTATSLSPFTVIPPPAITFFSPTSGPVGLNVDIIGTGLSGASEVRFNAVGASFTVLDDTMITAQVPVGSGAGPITIITPGGMAQSLSPFTVLPPPAITIFSPTGGPAGLNVDIVGTGFTGTSEVRFNGFGASFTVPDDTMITAQVPAGSGTGRITVTTPGGEGESISDFAEEPA